MLAILLSSGCQFLEMCLHVVFRDWPQSTGGGGLQKSGGGSKKAMQQIGGGL